MSSLRLASSGSWANSLIMSTSSSSKGSRLRGSSPSRWMPHSFVVGPNSSMRLYGTAWFWPLRHMCHSQQPAMLSSPIAVPFMGRKLIWMPTSAISGTSASPISTVASASSPAFSSITRFSPAIGPSVQLRMPSPSVSSIPISASSLREVSGP